ncbi:MAG TPA: CAP domain-containing protein [Polyangiaceae bacterium]|nr:CAP domain-containing protein [Polyangiaceae bacterium]
MARVPRARRFLGWLAASALACLALPAWPGCALLEEIDDGDVGEGLTPPPAPTSTGPSTGPDDVTGQVFTLVNEARATARSCGGRSFAAARPLRWSDALARAAQAHSEDMAAKGYFSHDSADGRDMAARVRAQGYAFSALGENIAAGQRTPAEVMAGWLESPGHCANIMNPSFQELGVGRAEGGPLDIYWTQNFGAPR